MSRARAVVEKFNDDCYMQPSDRACLETLITTALREAEAQAWTRYADEIERCRDIALQFPRSLTIEVLNDLKHYGRAQAKGGGA